MRKLKLKELGRKTIEEYKSSEKLPIVIVLDNLRSAHNVGSIFRTVDCLAFEKIILCGITARPPSNEIRKTAIGSTDSVEWSYQESIKLAVEDLKEQGYSIIGIEQTDASLPLSDYKFNAVSSFALVFGNEVDGLHEDVLPLLDQAIQLEQHGTKHSLNVSVCAGMVLWEASKQLRN